MPLGDLGGGGPTGEHRLAVQGEQCLCLKLLVALRPPSSSNTCRRPDPSPLWALVLRFLQRCLTPAFQGLRRVTLLCTSPSRPSNLCRQQNSTPACTHMYVCTHTPTHVRTHSVHTHAHLHTCAHTPRAHTHSLSLSFRITLEPFLNPQPTLTR